MTASTSSPSNTATASAKKSAIASSKISSKNADTNGVSDGFEVVQDSSINLAVTASFGDNTCVRSCSVDQLGMIFILCFIINEIYSIRIS